MSNTGYLGGLASVCATCLTHPLDTVKVHLQTQGKATLGFADMTTHIIRTNGFLSLYSGLSAAMLMSATYSTARFTFYEFANNRLHQHYNHSDPTNCKEIPFYAKVCAAGLSGVVGCLIGTPADICNIRMQNDIKLPIEKRRNYGNCFRALYTISSTEGFSALYSGFHVAVLRGILVTIGQLAFYDKFKATLLSTAHFQNNVTTHFVASMGAGLISTFITMPADVVKTLLMNARPNELNGALHACREVLKKDKFGLFKGFLPRYIRLGPFTIITFVLFEQFKSVTIDFSNK